MTASIVDTLTSTDGIVAAAVVAVGLLVALLNLRSAGLDALRSRAAVTLSAVELGPLDPASRVRVLTFLVTNRGRQNAVVSSVRLVVAAHGPSTTPRRTETMGGITVREHRVALEPGVAEYDIRAKLFTAADAPISLASGETEAFRVTLVAAAPQWYDLQVAADWCDARKPAAVRIARASVPRADFPPSFAEAQRAASP